ncbi:hypothetical protein ACLK2D_15185 [Escherichia coli]
MAISGLVDAGFFFQRANIEKYVFRAPRDRRDRYTAPEGILQTARDVVGIKFATWLAFFSPSAPIMRMYIQLIGRIEALPNGAAGNRTLTG